MTRANDKSDDRIPVPARRLLRRRVQSPARHPSETVRTQAVTRSHRVTSMRLSTALLVTAATATPSGRAPDSNGFAIIADGVTNGAEPV